MVETWNRVERSYDAIERALVPLGVSGIEDLLQDEVEETIRVGSWKRGNGQYLRACGVGVWMITGDKPNTAISIGRSTGIIDRRTRDRDVLLLDRSAALRDAAAVGAQLAAWTRDVEASRSDGGGVRRSGAAVRAVRYGKHVLVHLCAAAVQRAAGRADGRAGGPRDARQLCDLLPRVSEAEGRIEWSLLRSRKSCC